MALMASKASTNNKPNLAFERDAPKAARPSTLRWAFTFTQEK